MKKFFVVLTLSAFVAVPAFAGKDCDKAKCDKNKTASAQKCDKAAAQCPKAKAQAQAKGDCHGKSACSQAASKKTALSAQARGAELLSQQ